MNMPAYSEPDISSANSLDIDGYSASPAGSDEPEHDSGNVLQVEGNTGHNSG
jgi:hypothetical protein